jgi:threonine synthase
LFDIVYDLKGGLDLETARPHDKGLASSLWKYMGLLPVSVEDAIVSLGEGLTPLVRAERYGRSIGLTRLGLKLEFLNPTGSFKDRGTTVSVSMMKEWRISSALDDSSGNAGPSLAAYGAAAGIRCTLYAPQAASREKLIQAEMYGAKVVRVEGSRATVAARAEEAWRRGEAFYASHALSPFFIEGTKTIAFEIAEATTGGGFPDHVIFPVGGGSLLLGAWKGFSELEKIGRLERVPRLHCIQSASCDPVVRAFKSGKNEITPVDDLETVAAGIRISNPVRGRQVLDAVRQSGGSAESVPDDEILEQQRAVARLAGVFAEPTSCAALAGLVRLRRNGSIGSDEVVVVPLTGSGLKDSAGAARSLARPQ